MSTQWDDEVVDAVRSVICCKNDCFVLPLILFGISIAAMFTDLRDRYTLASTVIIIRNYISPEQVVSNKVVFSLSTNSRALD